MCGLGAAACSTFLSTPEHDFKYRWIGTDQWAAEHGSNVNIPADLQKANYRDYAFFGAFHTFDQFLPARKYFKDHPEYFALYDGERTPAQLCTSNREVQAVFAQGVKAVLRSNPQLTGVTLGPEDNRFFCECPACRALDEADPAPDQIHSRRLFLFYKKVSALVHEDFPAVIIRIGAYDTYGAPPKDKSLTLPPNTFPLICHFQQYCNNHPIEDPLCGPNGRFREVISGWQDVAGDLFIYEYYYKVNWLDLPWPIIHALSEDIPWYREHGVKGFYSQFHPDSAGSLLNAHVAAALLLDVHADVDRVIADFCRERFGPAQQEMRAYFLVLEEAMIASGLHIPHNGLALHYASLVFTDPVLNECERLLGLARARAGGTAFEGNVARFERLMEYTRGCVNFLQDAKEVLVDQETDERSAETREKAREALKKGEALVAWLGEERSTFQGVIPHPGEANPYLEYILDELREMADEESGGS
jgi:hypothetical protein